MPPSDALDRLHAYQAEALALIQRAEAMLADGVPRDIAGLARIRWALMRTLTGYQLFKHLEIFDPALAKATPAGALRLIRMKRACTDMGDTFRTYVQKWSGADTETQWPTYRAAALAMIHLLRAHIARERYEVGALLAASAYRSTLTPPPATAPPRPDRPIPAG